MKIYVQNGERMEGPFFSEALADAFIAGTYDQTQAALNDAWGAFDRAVELRDWTWLHCGHGAAWDEARVVIR